MYVSSEHNELNLYDDSANYKLKNSKTRETYLAPHQASMIKLFLRK